MLMDDDIAALIRAVRHVRVKHVGQHRQLGRDGRIQLRRTCLQRGHLVPQDRRLSLQRRRVSPGAAALPDLLGERVAARLPVLHRRQRRPAFGIHRQQALSHRRQSAPRHGGVEPARVQAYGAYVVHQTSTGFGSTIPAVKIEIS